jgi:hypothetical protein
MGASKAVRSSRSLLDGELPLWIDLFFECLGETAPRRSRQLLRIMGCVKRQCGNSCTLTRPRLLGVGHLFRHRNLHRSAEADRGRFP